MKFGELNRNIKDYLGRIGPGVTVVLSIIYQTKVYEGMYWYTEDIQLIEIDNKIEETIGKIEEYEEYDNIIKHLMEITADYKEVAPQLEDIMASNLPPDQGGEENSQ